MRAYSFYSKRAIASQYLGRRQLSQVFSAGSHGQAISIIEQRRKGIIQVISGKEKQGDAMVSIVIFLCVHLAFHYSSLTKQKMKIAVIC